MCTGVRSDDKSTCDVTDINYSFRRLGTAATEEKEKRKL